MDDEHAECSKTLRNLVETRCGKKRRKSPDLWENILAGKMVVGRLLSYWEGLFSGANC